MASILNNKINSYVLDRGIEFNETVTLTPTRTGTSPLGSFSRNTTPSIVWEPGVAPTAGSGSWKFTYTATTATNDYFRGTTATSTELLGINDSDYTMGMWIKINTLPTGNIVNALPLLDTGSTGTGFMFGITGTTYAYPSSPYLGFGGGTISGIPGVSFTAGTWNFIAVRRKASNISFYLNGSLLYSGSTTGTVAASTLMINATSARASTGTFNISNYFIAAADEIQQQDIIDIWNIGNTSGYVGSYANDLNASAVMPDPVITKYSDKIVNTVALQSNPEDFFEFNTASPIDQGSQSSTYSIYSGDGIYPSLNATGGQRGTGSFVLAYGGTTDTTPANLRGFGLTGDYDYGIGFWFKTNFTFSSALVHDTIYDLIAYGENHTGNTIVGIYGGIANSATKGKLYVTVGSGSAFISSNRVDDQKWHYIYARATNNGGIVTYTTYLDGVLLNTQTGAMYGGTQSGSVQIGDSLTVTSGTGALEATTFEFDKLIIGTSANVTLAKVANINDIATSIYTPPPGVSVSHTAEPMLITTSTVIMPTIVAVIGDHVEVTTSISVSTYMPDAGFSSGTNTTINGSALTALAIQNDVILDTNRDVIYSTTAATANTLLPEPLVSRPALRASATMPGGTASVAPNYFSMVKNQNPVYYIEDGQPTPHNYGTWTQTGVSTNQYFDTNVVSKLEMNAIGNRKSWEANTSGIILHNPLLQPTITNYKDNLNALYASRELSVEIWYYSIGHGSVVNHLSYEESGPIFNDGLTQISEVWDFFGCVPGSDPQNKIMLISERLHSYDINDPNYYSTWRSYPDANPKRNEWNHIVVTYEPVVDPNQVRRKLYLNGGIIGNELLTFAVSSINAGNSNAFGDDGFFANQLVQNMSGPTLGGVIQLSGSQDIKLHDGVQLDEFAIYPVTLSTSQVIDHYTFVKSLSPNTSYTQTSVEAAAKMGNHVVIPVMNVEYQESPFSALAARIPEPTIIGGKSKFISVGPIEATADIVNSSVSYGFTNYVSAITAYAEEAPGYALNSIYADYVNSVIQPYRYVTFDGSDPLVDYGSDADYSVASVVVNGTIVNPVDGINGKSAKTAGTSFANDGVILKESEYNDDWGTSGSHYHFSFWIERAIDDQSTTGARIIANAYSEYNGHYVLIYQYQNKLHLEVHNGSTKYTGVTTGNVDLFDYNRHQIVVDFDHSGSSHHYIKIYVDAVEVMNADIGTRKPLLINGTTPVGANSEDNNYPRLGIATLIMPFADTSIPVVPTNIKVYLDEILWAKTAIDQAGVTNLYAAIAGKTNIAAFPSALTASTLEVDPALSTEIIKYAPVLEVLIQISNPLISAEFNNTITVEPADASARLVETQRSDSVTLIWDVMLASAYVGGGGTPRVVFATPITASAALQNRKLAVPSSVQTNYPIKITVNSTTISTFDPESAWTSLLRNSTVDTMDLIREVI